MSFLQRRLWLGGLTAGALAMLLPQNASSQAGTGWLLLGLGTGAERPYRSCALILRSVPVEGGGKAVQMLRYPSEPGWGGKTWPWRTPQGQGELMLLALPAGDYELDDFELVQQTGETARVDRSVRPLQVRLRIQEGAIVYAGHYEARDLGIPAAKGTAQGVLLLSDRAEAATALVAAEGMTVLRGAPMRRQLPDPARLRHPQLLQSLADR